MTAPAPSPASHSGHAPRVSILIPNFNNGKASSRSGTRDFIADLLESLAATLAREPVTFELLAYDDGSTDDSRDTLRAWSRRSWPDGRPFLTLTEGPHCGILARNSNTLTRQARGEIIVRLDGDIICLTPNWLSHICALFDSGPPNLGIVVPKQLNTQGVVHEFGDFLLDPRGYRHNAHGLPREALQSVMEVDIPMGCFFAHKRTVFDALGGYDENFLRGQTVDFGLRSLLAGFRCWATPHVEYIHAHSERRNRETKADSLDGIRAGLDVFEKKWGFSRLFPDTQALLNRLQGTPALWNPRFAALAAQLAESSAPVQPPSPAALKAAEDEWNHYAHDPSSRSLIDIPLGVLRDVLRQSGSSPAHILHVNCGSGLAGHILARSGARYTGLTHNPAHLQVAQRMTSAQQYPAPAPPRFLHLPAAAPFPLDSASADALLVTWAFESHPNPVALWRELARVLNPGGMLVVFSRRARGFADGADVGEHRYDIRQLAGQMRHVGGLNLAVDLAKDSLDREIVLVARRAEDTSLSHPPQPARRPAAALQPA